MGYDLPSSLRGQILNQPLSHVSGETQGVWTKVREGRCESSGSATYKFYPACFAGLSVFSAWEVSSAN